LGGPINVGGGGPFEISTVKLVAVDPVTDISI
jgi:hypothetical protein